MSSGGSELRSTRAVARFGVTRHQRRRGQPRADERFKGAVGRGADEHSAGPKQSRLRQHVKQQAETAIRSRHARLTQEADGFAPSPRQLGPASQGVDLRLSLRIACSSYIPVDTACANRDLRVPGLDPVAWPTAGGAGRWRDRDALGEVREQGDQGRTEIGHVQTR